MVNENFRDISVAENFWRFQNGNSEWLDLAPTRDFNRAAQHIKSRR